MGCSGARAPRGGHEAPTAPHVAAPPQVVFQAPAPRAQISTAQAAALAVCGAADDALFSAAQAMAERQAQGARDVADAEQVRAQLRRFGAPYVWPRALSMQGGSEREFTSALQSSHAPPGAGEARCGLGLAHTSAGEPVRVALQVLSFGSLAPLPQRVAVGQTVTLDARFHREVRAPQAYMHGTGAPPAPLPVQSGARSARALFTPQRDGAYSLQLLGDLGEGPRPLFEVLLLAGQAELPQTQTQPSLTPHDWSVRDVLDRINQLRAAQNTAALTLDLALSAQATAHSEAMHARGQASHNTGAGNALARLLRAGIRVRTVGENVSYAATLREAQGGLERSPSHHANMLRPAFARAGLGIARDAHGYIYLTQLFAD